MHADTRCHCQSCTIRGLVGPAVLITLGVLFLLDQLQRGQFYFGNTWPTVLVVIGVIHLASALAPREGHRDPGTTRAVSPAVPPGSSQPPPQGNQGL